MVWIERKEGGVWAVGRAVNPQHRPSDEPRPDDYVFEGYELQDALTPRTRRSRTTSGLRGGRADARILPFKRAEVLGPLERWFFGRR